MFVNKMASIVSIIFADDTKIFSFESLEIEMITQLCRMIWSYFKDDHSSDI